MVNSCLFFCVFFSFSRTFDIKKELIGDVWKDQDAKGSKVGNVEDTINLERIRLPRIFGNLSAFGTLSFLQEFYNKPYRATETKCGKEMACRLPKVKGATVLWCFVKHVEIGATRNVSMMTSQPHH